MPVDEGFQLRVAPAVAGFLPLGIALYQVIRAKARLAGAAVHQRVVKAAHMPRGDPYLAVHQNGAVQAHVIGLSCTNFFHHARLTLFLNSTPSGP